MNSEFENLQRMIEQDELWLNDQLQNDRLQNGAAPPPGSDEMAGPDVMDRVKLAVRLTCTDEAPAHSTSADATYADGAYAEGTRDVGVNAALRRAKISVRNVLESERAASPSALSFTRTASPLFAVAAALLFAFVGLMDVDQSAVSVAEDREWDVFVQALDIDDSEVDTAIQDMGTMLDSLESDRLALGGSDSWDWIDSDREDVLDDAL